MYKNLFPVCLSLIGFVTAFVVTTSEPEDITYPAVKTAVEFVESWVVSKADAKPLEKKPRIVSLGGSLTEAIIALGHADKIVGVDTTSVYPPDVVKDFAKVGYVRQLSAEGILSLEPELIISTNHAGPKMAVEQIKKSGVKFEEFSSDYSVEGTKGYIKRLGEVLKEEKKAAGMVEAIDKGIAQSKEISKGFKRKPKVLFIYARGARMLNISGHTTSAHSMIELAGAENAFGDVDGLVIDKVSANVGLSRTDGRPLAPRVSGRGAHPRREDRGPAGGARGAVRGADRERGAAVYGAERS